MAEFLIIDSSSTYNVILGKGTLNEIKHVVFTYHLKLKFLILHGVGKSKKVMMKLGHVFARQSEGWNPAML